MSLDRRGARSANKRDWTVRSHAREHDLRIAEASFSGTIREQIETAKNHGVALLRRAESRQDDRAAIAALSQMQRGLTDLLELDAQQGAVMGNECPSVILSSRSAVGSARSVSAANPCADLVAGQSARR